MREIKEKYVIPLVMVGTFVGLIIIGLSTFGWSTEQVPCENCTEDAKTIFMNKMGIDKEKTYCREGFCDSVMNGRPVSFLCNETGCGWRRTE